MQQLTILQCNVIILNKCHKRILFHLNVFVYRQKNGNSIYVGPNGPEIEALVGSTAQLDCKVDALHDKLVIEYVP